MTHSKVLLAEDVGCGTAICIKEDGKAYQWTEGHSPAAITMREFKAGDVLDFDSPGRPMTYEEVEAV